MQSQYWNEKGENNKAKMKKATTDEQLVKTLDENNLKDKLGKGYSNENRMAKLTQYRAAYRRFKNDLRCPKNFLDEFEKAIN